MKRARRGSIINMSSIAWMIPSTSVPVYVTAKAAIVGLTLTLAQELYRSGVTVNCIGPGRIMSDQIRRNYTPEYRAWQSEHEIPMGRYGEPEELADFAVFLASPRGGYITGTPSREMCSAR